MGAQGLAGGVGAELGSDIDAVNHGGILAIGFGASTARSLGVRYDDLQIVGVCPKMSHSTPGGWGEWGMGGLIGFGIGRALRLVGDVRRAAWS